MGRYVQTRNPRSGRWVLIDRERGTMRHKSTPGPYVGVRIPVAYSTGRTVEIQRERTLSA